jgi:hemerythrin
MLVARLARRGAGRIGCADEERDVAIKWTDDLATGIERLDAQHRELYQEVAALQQAMRTHHLERVPAIIDFLQRYALEHFATEEREMAARGYPGLAEHAALHKAFVGQFLRHKALISAGVTPSAVLELSHWLSDWLRDHVRRVDGAMARHLRPPA